MAFNFLYVGNQGNRWYVASANIPTAAASSTYSVVFEGVRGKNYRSDIAIDDFSMTAGACPSEGQKNDSSHF